MINSLRFIVAIPIRTLDVKGVLMQAKNLFSVMVCRSNYDWMSPLTSPMAFTRT